MAFTQVSFARPDAEQFTFNPPPGTKVEEASAGAGPGAEGQPKVRRAASGEKPKSAVIGTGWTSVFVLDGHPGGRPRAPTPEAKKAQDAINQAPAGQRRPTFNSKLFSVLITDDGRVLVGAVSPSVSRRWPPTRQPH